MIFNQNITLLYSNFKNFHKYTFLGIFFVQSDTDSKMMNHLFIFCLLFIFSNAKIFQNQPPPVRQCDASYYGNNGESCDGNLRKCKWFYVCKNNKCTYVKFKKLKFRVISELNVQQKKIVLVGKKKIYVA